MSRKATASASVPVRCWPELDNADQQARVAQAEATVRLSQAELQS